MSVSAVSSAVKSLIRAGMPPREASEVARRAITLDHQYQIGYGVLTTGDWVQPPGRYVPRPFTATGWFIYAGTPPTGAPITVEVNKNFVLAVTLTIAAGEHAGTSATEVEFAEGDLISCDITSVGSGTAGSNLIVGWKGEPL